jgi:hypothetical protein
MRTPALGLLALAIACSDPQGPEISGEYAVHPGLGEPFVLEVGERALIAEADLDVRFLEVSADSRCPSHALILCVWQGDAAVVVETSPQFADAEHHTLHTTLDPKAVDLGTVTLQLVQLDPYPEDVGPIPIEDYRATFVAKATR